MTGSSGTLVNDRFRDLCPESFSDPDDVLEWNRLCDVCEQFRDKMAANPCLLNRMAARYAACKLAEFEILHNIGGVIRFGTKQTDSEIV